MAHEELVEYIMVQHTMEYYAALKIVTEICMYYFKYTETYTYIIHHINTHRRKTERILPEV